jgi:hypothetical protein
MLDVGLRSALIAFALPAVTAWCAPPLAPAALKEQVRPYLMKPLPTVEALVGMAMPPAAPMLVVASFGDDGASPATDRGYAVARTLNELLFGATRRWTSRIRRTTRSTPAIVALSSALLATAGRMPIALPGARRRSGACTAGF